MLGSRRPPPLLVGRLPKHVDRAAGSALVQGIIAMGHSLGLTIVAEGVESAEQAAVLTRFDCELAQGFHFARPLPGSEMDAALSTLPRERRATTGTSRTLASKRGQRRPAPAGSRR